MTDLEEALKIVSRAWGRKAKGYAAFPYIRGGDPSRSMVEIPRKDTRKDLGKTTFFKWPEERELILGHLASHTEDDLFWCPVLFDVPRRQIDHNKHEACLWADLDEVDPETIEEQYKPTIAWETSPDHYQALWIFNSGTWEGASDDGDINKKLTYYLGADKTGWDTTQLLRLPGWTNHKPKYKEQFGKYPTGRLLWNGRRTFYPDEFLELPEVPFAEDEAIEVFDELIDQVDRHEVWARVRLKVSPRVREFIAAKDGATGNRSEILWEIERELADAGCSVPEIVAIVKASAWNKYDGRADELTRLIREATKARAQVPDDRQAILEEEFERPKPTNLFLLVRDLKPPKWLIRGVLTEGAVGFIAGQPKSYKSWTGLDMALSVASGQPFLNHFPVEKPGPVLYIQEEDSGPLLKQRLGKVWPSKMGDKVQLDEKGEIIWVPPVEVLGLEDGANVDIDAYVGQTFTISDPTWQVWLDEVLTDKTQLQREKTENGDEVGYRLLLMDPLMMMAGDVEENRAQEMTTKIFRPLKELARKHGCAIQLIHHMKKGDPKAGPQRGGQLLLGSVANHAWAEDSLYFRLGRAGKVICEQESKNAPVGRFEISGLHRKTGWDPVINMLDDEGREPEGADGPVRRAQGSNGNARSSGERVQKPAKTLLALASLGPGTHAVKDIAEAVGVTVQGVYQAFNRLTTKGEITKVGTQYEITDKGLALCS